MINKAKPGYKKTPFNRYIKRAWILYLLLLPMVIYLLIFNYYPFFGLQLAFKDWMPRMGIWGSPWATDANENLTLFKHFAELFSTSLFRQKLMNTIRISLLKLLIGFPVPILLVIFLNELTSTRFMKFVQSVSYLPYFISWVVLGGIFLQMFSSGTIFQNILTTILGRPIYFFSDSKLYLVFLIASDIFKNCGWGTIIYLAALMNVDQQLYEAAGLDGAGRWRKILHITLPGLVPAITINLVLSMSNIMYAGFDQIYNTYNSAVYMFGDVLETYIFRIGIDGGRYDISTAVGQFNSTVGCILVLAANKIVKLLGGEGIW